VADPRVPLVSKRGWAARGALVAAQASWAEGWLGLGRLQNEGKEMTAQVLGCSLPFKINMFDLGFEREFEFDSLSNSNFTQLNSK
jgi:hypothetical protein